MVQASNNRISDLMGHEDVPPAAAVPVPAVLRTEAQREASRRNGSLGRGPVTAEGKARSRLNALKHGLLARVVAPPSDARRQDLMYEKARRRLVEEFRPATFSACAAVDALASDYVQLARARQMVEVLQRPRAMTAEDDQKWRTLRDRRRDLRLAERALARCDAGDTANDVGKGGDGNRPFDFKRPDADRLADQVAALMERARGDLADVEAEEARGEGPTDPFEWEEVDRLRRLMDGVGEAADRFADRAHMTSAFRGAAAFAPGDVARLGGPLAFIVRSLRLWLAREERFEEHVRRLQAKLQGDLARAPDQLMLLERYVAGIERAIERKLWRLERR